MEILINIPYNQVMVKVLLGLKLLVTMMSNHLGIVRVGVVLEVSSFGSRSITITNTVPVNQSQHEQTSMAIHSNAN